MHCFPPTEGGDPVGAGHGAAIAGFSVLCAGFSFCPLHSIPPHPDELQIVESTGSVMTPYMDFPELLAVLLKMLHEGTAATRREVMKVLGIIGALDPHTHKMNQASLKVWGGSVGCG